MLRTSEIIQFMPKVSNLLLTRNLKKKCLLYQTTNFNASSISDLATEEIKKKKKTPRIPKITLIHPDKSITINLLEDAEKIAKRRNFRLELVSETSETGRSVYELVDSFVHESKKDDRSNTIPNIKSTKMCIIQSKIADHDLNIKIRNVNNALQKKHCVKVQLYHDTVQTELLQTLKNKIQGKMTEERSKKGSTILTFLPLLDNNSISQKDDTSNN